MKKLAKTTNEVKGTAISILSEREEDYICLTNIARYKDAARTGAIASRSHGTSTTLRASSTSASTLKLAQPDRLQKLNEITIRQMQILASSAARLLGPPDSPKLT